MKTTRKLNLIAAALAAVLGPTTVRAADITPAETKAIAEEGFIYGLPIVMNYAVMYGYAVDRDSGQFKAPFNEIKNEPRVYTYKDTAIITPNSDTPYSLLWLDLRAEPMVLSVPAVEKSRYYAVMLCDGNTCNYGYIGSRATGSEAGDYLVAGPDWKGDIPSGIKKVFRSGTQFSLAAYRTQLFNPELYLLHQVPDSVCRSHRVCSGQLINRNNRRRVSIQASPGVVRLSTHFNARNVLHTHCPTVRLLADNDFAKFIRRGQATLSSGDVGVLLSVRYGFAPDLPGGIHRILSLDSVDDVRHRKVEVGELIGLQPQPHRVLSRT
jgi:hypothetical protein